MPPARAVVTPPRGVEILAPIEPGWAGVLSADALHFVALLARKLGPRRRRVLAERRELQARLDAGGALGFRPDTAGIRRAEWRVAPPPPDLADRRVEITGPVDRGRIVRALSSGAQVFMADFEDALSPTWRNVVEGQRHLRDAVRREIDFDAPGGKSYQLAERTATLVVRPRGLHLEERHVLVEGEPVPASFFDFGLYLFHNARELLARGTGPYVYLAKLEGHREARLWNDVFLLAQGELGLPRGTVRATVLIETLPAAFEMDEILFELREHACGLNCGRWDYVFSFIKSLRARPEFALPDRWSVGMDQPFLEAYGRLLVRTSHRRGAHAMGGMAAQIPIRTDERANREALERVAADKLREVRLGHDGTWVAHPGLVATARAVFDEHMKGPHQLDRPLGPEVRPEELLVLPRGAITADGLRRNVRVALEYLSAWLSGTGCVPIHNLMEDAATAEISRAQLWQWIHRGARLDDGRAASAELFRGVLEEEFAALRADGAGKSLSEGSLTAARQLLERLVTSERFEDFLTEPAYQHLLAQGH